MAAEGFSLGGDSGEQFIQALIQAAFHGVQPFPERIHLAPEGALQRASVSEWWRVQDIPEVMLYLSEQF